MPPAEPAPGHPEILRIVAPNPSPMTLGGTNTYVVGSDPAYVVDPGPADEGHVAAVRAAAESRGGLGGVLLTHAHSDHSEAVGPLGGELLWGSPASEDETAALLAAARAAAQGARPPPAARRQPELEERRVGPLTVIPTPGHAADHVVFSLGGACLCGDLVLGEGSSIVPPAAGGGSLRDYMRSLERLAAIGPDLLCPGHGPWITDPAAKIAEYAEHRLDRERRLRAALDDGVRSRAALLDAVWDDVPAELRPAAGFAMQAHLEKLAAEGVPLDGLEE